MTTAWIWRGLLALAILGIICSTVFLGMVLVAALRYRRIAAAAKLVVHSTPESSLPSVTVLKPVHGTEPRLAENLESFFQQDYPDFEIIIGARDADNPALHRNSGSATQELRVASCSPDRQHGLVPKSSRWKK